MLDCLFKAMYAALDQLSAGFIICGADGRIFHVNHAAGDMLEAGWPVRRHNQDFLRASDRARHDALAKGLRQVSSLAPVNGCEPLSLQIPLASGRSAHGAALATVRPLVMQEHPLLSIFITAPAKSERMEVTGTAACFGLTPAETRTLQQVAKGLSAIEAAGELKVSHNTIKTHLRNIFAKTKTCRQPDLVKLFAELTPPLREPTGNRADQGSGLQ
jgi:DNA-binding CsgD family transcriptional regulator